MAVSASQNERGRHCLRRFAFEWFYPELRGPQLADAAMGNEIHDVADRYHKDGVNPDEMTLAGQYFKAALPYAPHPHSGRSEGEFTMSVSGIEYTGKIDWEGLARELPGVPAEYADLPAALDYKTKKELTKDKMLIGPGQFLDDPQAIIYSAKRLVQANADRLYLRYVYLKREGKPKAKPSDAVLTRAEVSDAFRRIVHPTSAVIVQIKKLGPKGLDPLQLPPSPASCLKYGIKYACPHIGRCNLTPEQKIEDEVPTIERMKEAMDLLAQLQSQFGTAPQAAPAPVTPAPAPPPAVIPTAQVPAAAIPVQAAPAVVPVIPTVPQIAPSSPAAPGTGINPPETGGNISDAEVGRAVRILLQFAKRVFG